jgi:MtN3 and saliva related transmembrane protein
MIQVLVAILAPIVNCIQFLPQLYKTYITKSVKDLSFYSLLLILFTNLLWFLHGYFIIDYPLIISGLINMTISFALFTLYFLYKNKHQKIRMKNKK